MSPEIAARYGITVWDDDDVPRGEAVVLAADGRIYVYVHSRSGRRVVARGVLMALDALGRTNEALGLTKEVASCPATE